MEANKFKDKVHNVLKKENRLWNEEKTELNQTLLLDILENFNEKNLELYESIISSFLEDEELKSKFFLKVKDVFVFKTSDFKFFMEENKVYNSFTQYKNRIGLTDGKRFLKDSADVVLNFPYKDCVLEGGQSSEEGLDYYYEYEEEKTKTINKQKVIEPAGYKEKQSKRNEIFFNQILAKDEIDRLFDKKAFINWRRFTTDGEVSVNEIKRDEDGTIKENLIIKGNNLLTLHSLKSQFKGKVKLIYIDPPYNTGNDSFKYNDRFNHSTWLTFMKNRLEVARELLKDDGVIFIQCDDNEEAYLKVLMDEIFKINFINTISVLSSTPSGTKTAHRESKIIKTKDTILVYAKNKSSLKFNPQYTLQEKWDTHFNLFLEKDSLKIKSLQDILHTNNVYDKKIPQKEYDLNNVKFKSFIFKYKDNICQTGKSMPEDIRQKSIENINEVIEYKDSNNKQQYAYNGRRLSFLSNSIHSVFKRKNSKVVIEDDISKLVCDFWDDIDFNNTQNEGGVSLPSGKKPEQLIYRIIAMTTNKNDIVLDYHLGSGTTCAVAHKMNRQYIGIEQLDYEENDSLIRLQNVINKDQSGISKAVNWDGGGEFIYCELAPYNEKAKEEINKCNTLDELEKLFDTLYAKYFLNYNFKVKEFKEKVIKEVNFKALTLEEQKKMFLTMLDLNQMYVQYSEMADSKYGIDKVFQELTNKFYSDK